jgi:acyl dehydratase
VDSTFTFALVTGQSVTDISQNVFANLGWDEVRLPAPGFEGDTIYSRSEVLERRESRSRPDVGIVKVSITGFNQDGTRLSDHPPYPGRRIASRVRLPIAPLRLRALLAFLGQPAVSTQ